MIPRAAAALCKSAIRACLRKLAGLAVSSAASRQLYFLFGLAGYVRNPPLNFTVSAVLACALRFYSLSFLALNRVGLARLVDLDRHSDHSRF